MRKMIMQNILLIIAATLTALIAGLLYAYACSVNIGLGKMPDAGYLAAIQQINRAIQNPAFFASFMGTLLLLPVTAWLQYRTGATHRFYLLMAAGIVYIIGVFGVTMLGNIPLNTALDKFDLNSATPEQMAAQRANFEIPWNRLHIVRTTASVISLVLVIVACVVKGDGEK